MHLSYLLILILASTIQNVIGQDDPYRLPPNYIIIHQDIDLVVPEEAFTADSSNYSGSVSIEFQVTVETNEVKLHSSYSNLELLTISLDNDDPLTTDNYAVNSTTDILTLTFENNLVVGQNYTLYITFNAQLLSSGGFYKVSYEDEDGETQYTATTQFQSTNARNAFPCFDEPTYKSTFAFNLTYPSELSAWTNTPSVANNTVEGDENLVKTTFDVTPKMSVYLVAFTISKYTCTEGDLEGNSSYKQRVCSRTDMEEERSWALEVTPKVVDYLNDYTQVNYTESLSKLDSMAVPGKSGAMENWGLIIYGESALLYDNTVQTVANKQSIAEIIAHEVAHQWFGNLLTCKWWSETFLNEGFARLFQYYIVHSILPDYDMENQFVVKILQSMMVTDSYLGVPALRSNASTASEVSAKFSTYSYSKGASVFRMVEHIVGRETFKLGIQKYMQDNAYEPVEPQDLWDALEAVLENEVSTLPVNASLSDVVDNWINKGGFPVVTVSLVDSDIVISQQRFLFNETDDEDSSWYIPISYTTSSLNDSNEDTTPRGWVTPTESLTITNFTESNDWIVVNNQETGFYRVNYDSTLWESLAAALKESNFSGIHVVNRAQIVDDAYMLARAGLLTFGEVLGIVEFLEAETSYITWYPAINLFNYLLQKTGSTTTLGAALTSHFLSLVEVAVATVPLEVVDEDSQVYTLEQILLNNFACKYGNSDCIDAAKAHFATYKSTYERPNLNIRSIVYCNAIRYSDDPSSDWEFLYEQYQNSSVSTDSSYIWSALGCTTNTSVITSFLSKILASDDDLDTSTFTSIFSTVFEGSEVGVDTALDYFIENYEAIIEKFNELGLDITAIFSSVSSYITQTEQLTKLESLLEIEELDDSLVTAIEEAIETAKSNLEIVDTHKDSLLEYLGVSEEDEDDDDDDDIDSGAANLGKVGLMGLLAVALGNWAYYKF